MKNILSYIRSINFAVLICLLAMGSQAFHTFYSFHAVSKIKDIPGLIQTGLFVIVFEFFTLFYLMRDRKDMAFFYSSCLLVMNLYYYWINLTGLQLGLGIFLSVIIPLSIFNIADEVSKEFKKDWIPADRQEILENKIHNIEVVVSNKIEEMSNSIEELKDKKLGRKRKTIEITTPTIQKAK